jgi:hypothetical protein
MYGRSEDSTKVTILRNMTTLSQFNVLISSTPLEYMKLMAGTLFPLGPKTDARNPFQMMGGDFIDTHACWDRMTGIMLHRMRRSNTKGEGQSYSVYTLQAWIAPFTLSRGTDSEWDGNPIIEGTLS